MTKKEKRRERQQKNDKDVPKESTHSLYRVEGGVKEGTKRTQKLNKQLRQSIQKNKNNISAYPWCKITVTSLSAIDKKNVYESLAANIAKFVPYGFQKVDCQACFYVERASTSCASIEALSNRLQNDKGEKMKFQLSYLAYPYINLMPPQIAILKEAILKRYDYAAALLDLTKLHTDPLLVVNDIAAILVSRNVIRDVAKIICKSLPKLNSLNLSQNGLNAFQVCMMEQVFKDFHIKALCLANNSIETLENLKKLNQDEIIELNLTENKICSSLKGSDYVKHVKTVFPNLQMLDNALIESAVTTSESQNSVEYPKESMLDLEMLSTYLDQYYMAFDGTDRVSHLINAYTENITLEFVSKHPGIPSENFLGCEDLKRFLGNFPESVHTRKPFVILNQTPTSAAVQLDGKIHIKGFPESVDFNSKMMLVPMNGGISCSVHVIEVQ